ncbi:MAG: hypothetical protein A2Y17_01215 [Clostridiales bacterium GWF2_38_85]|nr:MAG: hypothetical protein A2Y17_01215 [Clostridiales bacterium GWF2_38_85]HBL85204.1 hypothetical protein [Clostridiales bacterium]
MRTIYLIKSNIVGLIKNNTFIFCIFCIGIFICNLMFTYAYINIKQSDILLGAEEYEIFNNKNNNIDIQKLEDDLAKYNVIIDYYTVLDEASFSNNNLDELGIDEYIKAIKEDSRGFCCMLTTRKDMSCHYTQKGKISDLDKPNSIIVISDIPLKVNYFPNININNIKYEVVGVAATWNLLTSFETYIENGLIPSMIHITLPGNTIEKDKIEFNEELNKLFDDSYTIQKTSNTESVPEKNIALIIITVVYILCAFTLLFLMTYLYEIFAHELSIYELIGATRRNTLFILSSTLFIILVCVGVISQAIHYLFLREFFNRINLFENLTYTLTDYIYVIIISVLLVFAFIFTYIYLKIQKSAITNSKNTMS